jgi:hypothetical protein
LQSSSSIPDGLEDELEQMMDDMNMKDEARVHVRAMGVNDKIRMLALYKERPQVKVSRRHIVLQSQIQVEYLVIQYSLPASLGECSPTSRHVLN